MFRFLYQRKAKEMCSSMRAESLRNPMQKEALSCFIVQLRGSVASKHKEPKGQICSQTSPRSSTLHLFVQGFFLLLFCLSSSTG